MPQTNEAAVTKTDKLLWAVCLPAIPASVSPNHVTLFRFILTPFVLYLLYVGQWLPALILFALAAFSDAVDGALARTRNQITDWGKVYDPIADKLLVGLSAIVIIPVYFDFLLVFLLILTEIMIILGAYWIRYYTPHSELQANIWGKVKMFIQSVSLTLLILAGLVAMPSVVIDLIEIALYTSLMLAVISAVYAGL